MDEKIPQKYAIEDLLRKVLLAIAGLFLIVSIFGIYTSINDLINIWIGYKYAPIYKALLNLAILSLSLYTLTQLVRQKEKKKPD